MVIVNLMGGLGNQLFQYATGRSLAFKLNTALKTDHTFLEADTKEKFTKRFFELGVFNIASEKALEKDLEPFRKMSKNDFVSRISKKIRPDNSVIQFNEQGFGYNPDIEKITGSCYLSGYWQTEKYFSAIRNILLEEISLKVPFSREAEKIKEALLKNEKSVSIHFRRGDYVNLASANSYHGTTQMEYYKMAVEKIRKEIQHPVFFIFSDDIEWVKQNFILENAVYISGLKNYEDLELMKNCRHNIIANSSFSWWSAWLNQNPDKIVIAPEKWFADETIKTNDLIPSHWHRI